MGYNAQEIYPSNSDFLKSEDIGNSMPTYTVSRVELKEFGANERKLVLMFVETEKGMVLNKTNSDVMSDLYTPDTDMWHGKQVMLFTMPVEYQGNKTLGLRLRAPATQSAPQPQSGQEHSELNPPPHQ
jgi:hypothetical protein